MTNTTIDRRWRFEGGDPTLTFTTPIDPKSIGAFALSPKPPAGATAFAAGYDGVVGVNASLLAPNTTYAVTIAPSLRDTFGQKLDTRAARDVPHRRPRARRLGAERRQSVSGGARRTAERRRRQRALDVTAIFRVLRPADVVQWPDPSGAPDRGDMLPPALRWPRFDASGPRNVERTIDVPLRAKLGARTGVLAYGVRAPILADQPFVAAGVVQLTDLGAFVQLFPDAGASS